MLKVGIDDIHENELFANEKFVFALFLQNSTNSCSGHNCALALFDW